LTAVIVGFARTPIGKFGGIFKDISAPDLASIAIKAALNRSGVSPEEVDEVIMGNVIQAGIGMNPARQAAVKAGIPWRVPGFTISKVCASGLRAVSLAASIIKLGEAKVIVAGGMESMSNAPYMLSSKWRWGVKFSYAGEKVVDLMVYDGLTDPHTGMFMGEEAELTAKKFGITREEADRFAVSARQSRGMPGNSLLASISRASLVCLSSKLKSTKKAKLPILLLLISGTTSKKPFPSDERRTFPPDDLIISRYAK